MRTVIKGDKNKLDPLNLFNSLKRQIEMKKGNKDGHEIWATFLAHLGQNTCTWQE